MLSAAAVTRQRSLDPDLSAALTTGQVTGGNPLRNEAHGSCVE
jgi:hypothetical protein